MKSPQPPNAVGTSKMVCCDSREHKNPPDNSRGGFLSGTTFGVILGAVSTLIYQYITNILRQPRLASKAVLADLRDFDTQETRALFIANESLQAGIEERHLNPQEHRLILHAGYRNFRESWARDFGFAAYGLLSLNEYRPVKETLGAFLWHQKIDGQLPVKLRSMSVVSRFFHSVLRREQPLDAHLTPKYITGHRSYSFDGQALLVIAASRYIKESGDREFVQEYWDGLQLAMRWLRKHTHQDTQLLSQSPYADWADSVARQGVVCYTNVVYWKALMEMASLAEFLGYADDHEFYQQLADDLKADIQTYLWRSESGYFATSPQQGNLSSAGNLLSIAWGLANESQANSVLDRIRDFKMATPVPTQAAYPPYQLSDISIENRLGGVANYHAEGAWLWIGAWHIIALCRMGRMKAAHDLLSRLADVIIRDQQIYEVYGPDGQPLSSVFYSSEAPLTWNAGMVIYAYHFFEKYMQ